MRPKVLSSCTCGNTIAGSSIQGFAHSWGRLFLFVGIGLLLFVFPRISPVTTATLTGYTLTILYLTHPLDGILGWLPAMNSASIALSKIDRLGLLIDDSEEQAFSHVTPPFVSLELRAVTYGYTSPDGRQLSSLTAPRNKAGKAKKRNAKKRNAKKNAAKSGPAKKRNIP